MDPHRTERRDPQTLCALLAHRSFSNPRDAVVAIKEATIAAIAADSLERDVTLFVADLWDVPDLDSDGGEVTDEEIVYDPVLQYVVFALPAFDRGLILFVAAGLLAVLCLRVRYSPPLGEQAGRVEVSIDRRLDKIVFISSVTRQVDGSLHVAGFDGFGVARSE
jgi:hypothetical protein